MKRLALFSLSDPSHADRFAAVLIANGWEILATSETVHLLRSRGIPVQDIADFIGAREDYGFPPTLHPKVEYALTGDGSPRIELVYDIPYPRFQGNDVGGRTLLALAVKGGRIAVMSIADMERVIAELGKTGTIPTVLRLDLADKACYEIARHYAALAMGRGTYDFLAGRFAISLLNGENPYQIPASLYVSDDDDPLAFARMKQVSGEAPCFTNLADADSIMNALSITAEAFRVNRIGIPFICIAAKHGNPCGVGVSEENPVIAVEKALFGNPRSIWGGEVITNFPIDGILAEVLFKSERRQQICGDHAWMLDLVLAPAFSAEAVAILGRRRSRKLFANSAIQDPQIRKTGCIYRPVRGGFLRQPPATYIIDIINDCQGVKSFPTVETVSMIIAWAAVFSSNHGGNEVALAKDGQLLSVGGGPSTLEAAQVAVERARACGHDCRGGAFAADAFFPFTDAPELICDAGIARGSVPSGGKRENEIRAYFAERRVDVIFLPEEIRGFCRH